MSGFANSGDIPFLMGFVAVTSVVSSVITIVMRRLRPNASNAAVVIGSGLALPALIFSSGFAAFMLIPAGESPDGPGMLLAGVIGLTIVALPISLITSVVVISTRQR